LIRASNIKIGRMEGIRLEGWKIGRMEGGKW
jgi:hypothetical protein